MALTFREPNPEEVNEMNGKPWQGTSPWTDGLEIEFTGYAYLKGEKNLCPTLTTNIGQNFFISLVTKTYACNNGTTIRSEGDATEAIRKAIEDNNTKTNKEVLEAILAVVKGKKIKITRKQYIKLGEKVGYPAATVNLNFC